MGAPMTFRSASILVAFSLSAIAACGDDGGTATPDASIDGAGGLTCDAYCTAVTANCTAAADKQYNDRAQCLASCAFLPPGSLADTQGNTLGCRIYHGGAPAAGNPTMHCPHAGPGGDSACGTDCAGFCQLVLGACTGANAQFGSSMATCMTQCAAFPTARYSTTAQTGNTLACRLYHATVASTDPATHCPHTAAMDQGGGFPCR